MSVLLLPLALTSRKNRFSHVACSEPAQQEVSTEEIDALISDMKLKLKDPDPRTRAFAAKILGGHGEKAKDAIPELRELTKDKSADVRAAAKTALGLLEGAQQPGK